MNFFKKTFCLLSLFNCSLIFCSNFSILQKDYGYRVGSDQVYINNVPINNNGNYGVYSISPKEIINNSVISNNGTDGLIAYTSKGLICNNLNGIIKNNGNTGFYGQHCSNLKNLGLIENKGKAGMFLDMYSSGTNLGIIKNSGKNGVYVYKSSFLNGPTGIIDNNNSFGLLLTTNSKGENNNTIENNGDYGVVVTNNSNFINNKSGNISNLGDYGIYSSFSSNSINNGTVSNSGDGGAYIDGSNFVNSGTICNCGNDGLLVTDNGTAINNGLIKNKGFYGVEIFSSDFTNNGVIHNSGPYAISLNGNSSILTLNINSDIHGIVENEDVNNAVLNLENINNLPKVGNINFPLINFSTIKIHSGVWRVSSNIDLIAPNLSNINSSLESTKDLTGTLIINPKISIVIPFTINNKSNAIILTDSFTNNGTIIGKSLDRTYVTNKKEILIPAILSNKSNDKVGNVKVENIASGWNGSYLYKNNSLFFKLDKINKKNSTSKNLLGGYKSSIDKYPLNNLIYLDTTNLRNKVYTFNRNKILKDTNFFQFIVGTGDNHNLSPKYHYNSYGFIGDTIKHINSNINLSLTYGYLKNNISYNKIHNTKEDIDNFFLALTQKFGNKTIGILQESLTYSKNNLNRYIIDRDKNNSLDLLHSTHNQSLITLGGEVGQNFKIKNNLLIYPYVSFNNYFFKNYSYSEQGDFYALNIKENNHSYPVISSGLQCNFKFKTFKISENISYNYLFNNKRELSSDFIFNPQCKFFIIPNKTEKKSVNINLDIEKKVANDIILNFDISSNICKNSKNLMGGFELTYFL